MRSRYLCLGFTILVAGCWSPGSFIQQTSQSLSSITSSFATFETFKATIATNASYARLAYADTLTSTAIITRQLPKQKAGDICLNYAVAQSVKDADILAREKDLQLVLTQATNLLCTGSKKPTDIASPAPSPAGGKSGDTSSGPACPVTKEQASLTKFGNFLNSFSAAAGLTPAAAYATAIDSAGQLGIQIYEFAGQQRDYQLAVAFLRDPKTQLAFKYAVERLESDLKSADDDLETNMHIWRKCETARLGIAQAKLNWNDGASVLIFSREAVESKKTFDAVRAQYLVYKKSFVSSETDSLVQLEAAFSKLPTLDVDPSSLDAIVKAFGTVQTNIQKLDAASASASATPRQKTAAAGGPARTRLARRMGTPAREDNDITADKAVDVASAQPQ